ncbi:MAG: sugar ABC transporter ATP-binding protein [Halanaerobiales bacterium]|nr:sugar ABC transporter ATP-binding protein [Halanaerobiales bacterium]
MNDNEKYLLKMENISKDFYGNKVLHNVNLTIKPGEIIGLVGENGAGKSTLMNILFGLSVIHETGGFGGKIIFDGAEVNFASPFEALEAGIGMVHQEFVLIPGFTATENILLNREPSKYNYLSEVFGDGLNVLDRVEMKQRAMKAIETLEVDLHSEMLVNEMPVGHRQFTEIAREIDRKTTKLLVLDEPTAVLTESEADIVLKAIRKLADKGMSVIFISHRLQEIMDCCDKIVVLRDGEIQKELTPPQTNPNEIAELMVGRDLAANILKANKARKIEEVILEVNDLWVDMPGEQVNGISVEIKKGEIFGIGGLTGQGKLGIANGIMGLYPAQGKVIFNGNPIELNNSKSVLKQGMAFVSEDRRGVGLLLDQPLSWNIVFTAMQVKEDFIKPLLGGLIKWCDDKALTEVSKEYIETLKIKCVDEKQLVRELSGGNQQKVCMAKAFVLKPEIMFVSEPTRGIDVGAKSLVLETLRRYNEEYGTTIIITSSELEELRSISDRIAIVNEGKIVGILPPTAEPVEFGLLMLGKTSETKKVVANE